GGARIFPATTAPVDRGCTAGRVEVAVRGHRSTEGAGLRRVTRDLTGRLALGVAHVGDEADVVGQVVVRVDEQRATLERRHHVHLVGRLAGVSRALVVPAANAEGVAATIGNLPRISGGGGRETPVAPLANDRGAVLRVARVAVVGEPAVARPHAFFLVGFGSDGDRAAVAGHADQEVVGLLGAVAFAVLAEVGVGFRAFEVLAGDDVDHAGHGVR